MNGHRPEELLIPLRELARFRQVGVGLGGGIRNVSFGSDREREEEILTSIRF